jgi:hypothetical protein
VEKRIFSVAGFGGLCLLLAGCNVGSDQPQPPIPTDTSQPALASSSQPLSRTLAAQAPTAPSPVTTPSHTQTYYLVLHGFTTAGERIGYSIALQKAIPQGSNPDVQLTWFEPTRNADGSCLSGLAGYDLQYGLQPDSYYVSLRFDLASRDMSCTTVGTTECGDVRECHYTLTL